MKKLLIFTRYPVAGQVKTRLIPALGESGARNLHCAMVMQTLAQAANFDGKVEIHYAGGNQMLMKRWLGERYLYRAQAGCTLGERLTGALAAAFSEGAKKALVIGTDCPDLKIEHLIKAINLLDRNDLVIGPARDGGYYLVGLNKLHRELFDNISWGSNLVFRQTMDAAKRLLLKTAALETLSDIDRPGDLPCHLSLIPNDPE